MILSERVLSMQESATLAMARAARELKAKGVDVINLSLGEPDFDTPQHIKDAAKDALDKGYTKYTPVAGLQELREAIQRKFKRDNNLDYALDEIVVSTGAKQSIANVCLAILNKGDEVLLPAPYWVSYAAIAELAEGKAVEIPTTVEENFKLTAEKLEKYITPKTKLLIYSSPCNPTGSVYSKDELASLVAVLEKHPNVFILSDEIYEYINYTGKHVSIASFPSVKNRTITVNGFAKGYAMTGWRLGYIGTTKEIASACDKIQGQITSGTNAFAQKAAITALDGDMQPTETMRLAFQKRRELVLKHLQQIPNIKCNTPEGAFYVFPDVSAYFGKSANGFTVNNSNDLALYLLEQAHVATVGGDSFGDNNGLRISYAASEEQLTQAMQRIKDALSLLS